MAHCNVPNCNWYGKSKGLKVHQAKVHNIHPIHDFESPPSPEKSPWESPHQAPAIKTELEDESNALEPSSCPLLIVCPVVGCKALVTDLRMHAHVAHSEWMLSNGRFVFEVV